LGAAASGRQIEKDVTQDHAFYLVPALLPVRTAEFPSALTLPPGADDSSNDLTDVKPSATICLFVFTCDPSLRARQPLTLADTARQGFLPKGLFERLLCKVINWARTADFEPFNDDAAAATLCSVSGDVLGCVYQDYAELRVGKCSISLRALPEANCIILGQECGDPWPIHDRLCELMQEILSECMKSLTFFTAVVAGRGDADNQSGGKDACAPSVLIPQPPNTKEVEWDRGGGGNCVQTELVLVSTLRVAAQGGTAAWGDDVDAVVTSRGDWM
jgi:hypothetical protein